MSKTKNSVPSSGNILRGKNVLAIGLVVGAAVLGKEVILNQNDPAKADAEPTAAALVHQGVARLESFQTKHHNIISVAPDPKHPGLERVTYRFTPGHNTVSSLAAEVAPDQIRDHADADIEGYNGDSEVVQFGQEITVDVDPTTGFIVENPDLPPSAEDNS